MLPRGVYEAFMKEPLQAAVRWSNFQKLEENLVFGDKGVVGISPHFCQTLNWLPWVSEESLPVEEAELKRIASAVFRNPTYL